MCYKLAENSAGAAWNIKHIWDYKMTVPLLPCVYVAVTNKQIYARSFCSYPVRWEENQKELYPISITVWKLCVCVNFTAWLCNKTEVFSCA